MKVYTKLVIDIETNTVLEEESFEYGGSLALCSGSGGGSGVDKEYNARMATIAESQQGMADWYFNWATGNLGTGTTLSPSGAGYTGGPSRSNSYVDKSGNKITYKDNQVFIPGDPNRNPEGGNSGSWLSVDEAIKQGVISPEPGTEAPTDGTTTGGAPVQSGSYMDMLTQQIGANISLIGPQTELAKSQMAEETARIGLRSPMLEQLKTDTMKGSDVRSAMSMAGSEVSQKYGDLSGAMRREAGRAGLNPQSGRFLSMLGKAEAGEARDVGYARTIARKTTEESNLANLRSSLQII